MRKTRTVGYFNPNTWPVVVNLSAVNLNLTVNPKQYVTNREGFKVNDPILDNLVGPDMLARESSKTEEFPLILFPRPVPPAIGNSTGVASSSEVIKNSRGIVQDSTFEQAGLQASSPASAGSVQVYSVEQAVKKGVLKPIVLPDESRSPKETAGEPGRGDNIPQMRIARDATPKEAQQMLKEGTVIKEKKLPTPPSGEGEPEQPMTPVVSEEEEHTPEDEAFDGIETFDVATQLKSLTNRMGTESTPEGEEPREEEKKEKTPLPSPVTAKKVVENPAPFMCAADGKTFKYRKAFVKHVEKNYPDRAEELLAPYQDE